MRRMHHILAVLAVAALGSLVAFAQAPQQPAAPAGQGAGGGQAGRGAPAPKGPPSFFITSVGKGDGANYGGIAGADAYCAQMAKTGGLETPQGRTWRAYLSQPAAGGQPAVNARDRIGAGPWFNARGAVIAQNVADLHGDVQRDRNQVNKSNALSEKGMPINGRGDTPNQHDILTGSDSLGKAIAGDMDSTCSNYTSNADGRGSVMLGHHDRDGGGNTSWNSAHGSRGCSQPNLVATGGAGLLYCFAAN
jgi:hypothetical protein